MVDLRSQTRSYQKDSRQHSLGQRHGSGIGRVALTLFPKVSCPVGQSMALSKREPLKREFRGGWRLKVFADLVQLLNTPDLVVEHAMRIVALRLAIVKDRNVFRDHFAYSSFRIGPIGGFSAVMQAHSR